jgi:hypothetical protein
MTLRILFSTNERPVVGRNMARPQFWTFNQIVCHVHELILLSFYWDGPRDINRDCDQLGSFFQILPRFLNLRKLSCSGLPFDNFWLRQLHKLENFRQLKLSLALDY